MNEVTKVEKIGNTKDRGEGGVTGALNYWMGKMVQPLWKTGGQFPLNLGIHLPRYSAITLLGILSGDIQTYVQERIYRRKFIETLFKITSNWKSSL